MHTYVRGFSREGSFDAGDKTPTPIDAPSLNGIASEQKMIERSAEKIYHSSTNIKPSRLMSSDKSWGSTLGNPLEYSVDAEVPVDSPHSRHIDVGGEEPDNIFMLEGHDYASQSPNKLVPPDKEISTPTGVHCILRSDSSRTDAIKKNPINTSSQILKSEEDAWLTSTPSTDGVSDRSQVLSRSIEDIMIEPLMKPGKRASAKRLIRSVLEHPHYLACSFVLAIIEVTMVTVELSYEQYYGVELHLGDGLKLVPDIILYFFVLESFGHLFVNFKHVLSSKLKVLDIVVLWVSVGIHAGTTGWLGSVSAYVLVSRLFRIAKIMNGVAMNVAFAREKKYQRMIHELEIENDYLLLEIERLKNEVS